MAKARRKQAEPGGQKKAERKQARAGGQTKPERKKARDAHKREGAGAASVPGKDAPLGEQIEWRLVRIEEALASESARSEELLQTVDELLGEEPESETAKVAPGPAGGDE